jgi:hypothetical protein
MPTVAREGQFQFRINTREDLREPPHVHVVVGGQDMCRINLDSGEFIDNPPSGEAASILAAYRRYAAAIRMTWDEIHKR